MFGEHTSSGKHLICDLKGIKNQMLLNSISKLKELMSHICYICEFVVLDESSHQFLPIGCTIIYLLSESHMSIHTFPEKDYIAFDLYTCKQYESNDEYEIIYKYLLTELDASSSDSTYKIIDRMF